MDAIAFLLLVLAALSFAAATFGYPRTTPPAVPRFHPGWLGLLLVVVALLVADPWNLLPLGG